MFFRFILKLSVARVSGKMEKVQQFFTNLKLKWQQRHQTTTLIHFSDCFPFEFFFKFWGLPFLQSYNPQRDFYRRTYFAVINIFNVFVAIFSLISACYFINMPDSFIKATENVVLFCAFLSFSLKTYYIMILNHEKIVKVVNKLDEHFPMHSLDQDKFKVANYLKRLEKISNLAVFMYIGTGISYVTFPFQTQIYGLLTSQLFELETILAIKYPFDMLNPISYSLVYIFESCVLFNGILVVLFTDIFIAELLCVLSMEFDILSHLIAEIDLEDGDEDAIKELKKLVDIHQQLIEVAESLEEFFSPVLLVDLLVFISCLCIAALFTVVCNNFYIYKSSLIPFFAGGSKFVVFIKIHFNFCYTPN